MAECSRRQFKLALGSALATSSCQTQPAESAASSPPIWGALAPGPCAVGFEVCWLRDETRPAHDGASGRRAIQASVWRPARPGTGAAMNVLDYARLLSERDTQTPATWPDRARAQFGVGLPPGSPPAAAEVFDRINVYSRHASAARAGRFPLVLLAQGLFYESPFHQFLLAEYLASHGFVVATAALTGAQSVLVRLGGEDLEAEVRDLECVAAALARDPSVDGAASGLIGWDLGGMAGLLYAARNPSLRALACFDSGVTFPGLIRLFLTSDFSKVGASMLIATRPLEELRAVGLDEDLSLLHRLDWVERILIRLPGMRHADFSIHAMLEAVAPHFWGPPPGDPARQYPRLAEIAHAFMATKLAQSPADALQAKVQDLNGEVWPAALSPPSFADLAAEVLAGAGPDGVQLARITNASRGCDEASLERLASELLYRRGDIQNALAVARLGLRLFPASADISAVLTDAERLTE